MQSKRLLDLRLVILYVVISMSIFPLRVYAFCLDNRHPDVLAEYAKSAFVIFGSSIGMRIITTPDDPEGIAAKVYTVKTLKTLKGSPEATIDIWSENTSSRFDFDGSAIYLLFINSSPDGYYVDSCGNSGVKNDPAVIKALDRLKSVKDFPNKSPL